MPTIPKSTPARPWMPKKEAFKMKVDNGRFYRSAKWIKLRDAFRLANPLCVNVDTCGNAMYYVDHIVPIAEGGAPLDWGNLQSLCVQCNASKTGKQAWKKSEL